jgi:hypothetical protein
MRYLALAGLLAACGSVQNDAVDAGMDPSGADAQIGTDAASDAPLDGSFDVPLAGFGDLSGMCGVLEDPELTGPQPVAVHVSMTFARRYQDPDDRHLLTEGGARLMETPNAGGSSLMSEAFAYEQLARCELAKLLKTETEVQYDTQGSITDLLVEMDGHKIGVSVTRAFAYPPGTPYTVEAARTLLERKLEGIQEATANVSAEDRWRKQVLAYMSWDDQSTASLDAAWAAIDPGLKGDTILVITTTHGDDQFLYTNN